MYTDVCALTYVHWRMCTDVCALTYVHWRMLWSHANARVFRWRKLVRENGCSGIISQVLRNENTTTGNTRRIPVNKPTHTPVHSLCIYSQSRPLSKKEKTSKLLRKKRLNNNARFLPRQNVMIQAFASPTFLCTTIVMWFFCSSPMFCDKPVNTLVWRVATRISLLQYQSIKLAVKNVSRQIIFQRRKAHMRKNQFSLFSSQLHQKTIATYHPGQYPSKQPCSRCSSSDDFHNGYYSIRSLAVDCCDGDISVVGPFGAYVMILSIFHLIVVHFW